MGGGRGIKGGICESDNSRELAEFLSRQGAWHRYWLRREILNRAPVLSRNEKCRKTGPGPKLRKVNSNRFDMEMNLKLNLLVKHLPPELLLSAIDMRRIATRFSENFSELTTPVHLKLLSKK